MGSAGSNIHLSIPHMNLRSHGYVVNAYSMSNSSCRSSQVSFTPTQIRCHFLVIDDISCFIWFLFFFPFSTARSETQCGGTAPCTEDMACHMSSREVSFFLFHLYFSRPPWQDKMLNKKKLGWVPYNLPARAICEMSNSYSLEKSASGPVRHGRLFS